MDIYWASCSSGLQFVLTAELQNLDHTRIVSDTLILGGVIFSTQLAPTEVLKLRSADSIYAFVGKFENVPSEKHVAIPFLKELAKLAEWELPLKLFWKWKSSGIEALLEHQANSESCGNLEIPSAKEYPLSFRVSCDRACVNMKKHGFTSMEAAAALGEGIHKQFCWHVDMCYYDLEVLAWIRDDEAVLALALLDSSKKGPNKITGPDIDQAACLLEEQKESFTPCQDEPSKKKLRRSLRASRGDCQLYSWRRYRNALVETSLKPSIAHALLHLGGILPGDVVIDPMCGCGTIPLEAADWLSSQVFCIAGDLAPKAVDATHDNINASRLSACCDLTRWNASKLPLRTGVVDRIVCDMPFGVRCGSTKTRDSLCPKVLKEVVRVLRPATGIAVLLGQSKAVRHEIQDNQSSSVSIRRHLPIEMNGLRVEVLVIQRTAEPYTA